MTGRSGALPTAASGAHTLSDRQSSANGMSTAMNTSPGGCSDAGPNSVASSVPDHRSARTGADRRSAAERDPERLDNTVARRCFQLAAAGRDNHRQSLARQKASGSAS